VSAADFVQGTLDALREQVATLTRERDEARAEAVLARDVLFKGVYGVHFDSCGCPACEFLRKPSASTDWLAERLAAQREACAQAFAIDVPEQAQSHMARVRNTPLVNGSDSWLAEVKAAARDAALEEAAKRIEYEFSLSVHSQLLEAIRALKRGGK